jgi:hypothetical protein
MLWLLQCLDGESSSGESPVPQIRSIGQFLLSRLFSSLNSSVLDGSKVVNPTRRPLFTPQKYYSSVSGANFY